jgi:hypothetical protein
MRVRAGQITVQSFALLFAVAMVAMSGYIAQYDLQCTCRR